MLGLYGLNFDLCIFHERSKIVYVQYFLQADCHHTLQIVGRESKPHNSDFYQNDFLSMREYQTHGAQSVKFS